MSSQQIYVYINVLSNIKKFERGESEEFLGTLKKKKFFEVK